MAGALLAELLQRRDVQIVVVVLLARPASCGRNSLAFRAFTSSVLRMCTYGSIFLSSLASSSVSARATDFCKGASMSLPKD
jgi:hypothetical protein